MLGQTVIEEGVMEGMMSQRQYVQLRALFEGSIIRSLTAAEADRILDRHEELQAQVRQVQRCLSGGCLHQCNSQDSDALAVHEDLRYLIKVGEDMYEAVGFLKKGERRVSIRDALNRTGAQRVEAEVVTLQEVAQVIDSIPEHLNRFQVLITGHAFPEDRVRVFARPYSDWVRQVSSLNDSVGYRSLVLRRFEFAPDA